MSLNNIATLRTVKIIGRYSALKSLIIFSTIICGLTQDISAFSLDLNELQNELITENKVHKDFIKTVQIRKQLEYPSYPILKLGSDEQLTISFDDLSDFDDDYYYRVVHCSHDWIPSDLESNEYIQGFPELSITDIEPSFNSVIPYTHYEFNFPSDMMAPTLSGNYLLMIYPYDEDDDPIISARIVIYEELIRYRVNVKESSVIRERTTSQEIDFDVVFNGYTVNRPYEDIHNIILQNFNWNTSISDLPPVFVKNNEINYDYGEENNFKGSNEFRFFGLTSLNGASARMDSLTINSTSQVAEIHLKVDESRAFKLYTTNRDINGDYKINSLLGFDDDLEAEYCEVNFYLDKDTPLSPTKEVHVIGALHFNEIGDISKMTYNYRKKRYELKALLKQGYYNYLYAVKEGDLLDLGYLEGNHFQTENDFHIFTYDSNSNLGYDRVIGIYRTNTFNE